MPLGIEQNVSIVSIFDLQNVAKQRVPSHRPHEVLLGTVVPRQVLLVFLRACLIYNVLSTFRNALDGNFLLCCVSASRLCGLDIFLHRGSHGLDGDVTISIWLRILINSLVNLILKGLNKVLPQVQNVRILLLKLINRDRVWDGFNEAAGGTSGNNIKWLEPQFKFVRLENCIELFDKLRCELLLSEVVGTLNNDRHNTIIRHLAIITCLLRLSAHLVERFSSEQTRRLLDFNIRILKRLLTILASAAAWRACEAANVATFVGVVPHIGRVAVLHFGGRFDQGVLYRQRCRQLSHIVIATNDAINLVHLLILYVNHF